MAFFLVAVLLFGVIGLGGGDVDGTYKMTFYWTTRPADVRNAGRMLPIYDSRMNVLGHVDEEYLKVLSLEGSGFLPDGRLVNLACDCPYPDSRFMLVDSGRAPWGYGARKDALQPFRSVAVDPRRIPLGTKLFIAVFKGFQPGGGVPHDGCFVAVDTGYGVSGRHIDVFAGTKSAHHAALNFLNNASHVEVKRGSSENGCDS